MIKLCLNRNGWESFKNLIMNLYAVLIYMYSQFNSNLNLAMTSKEIFAIIKLRFNYIYINSNAIAKCNIYWSKLYTCRTVISCTS